jgi:hypothetical protein
MQNVRMWNNGEDSAKSGGMSKKTSFSNQKKSVHNQNQRQPLKITDPLKLKKNFDISLP